MPLSKDQKSKPQAQIYMNLLLEQLKHQPLNDLSKGLPFGSNITPAQVKAQGWNILRGDLPFPSLLLKESVLDYNLRTMSEWCANNNLLLAPHGKTTMCPQMYERQLAQGAWAITIANIAQAMVCARFGIRRIVIANQIVGAGNLRALAALMKSDDALELYCLVDSVAGVHHLAEGLRLQDVNRTINIFIECGRQGWRTGVRNEEQAVAVFEALAQYPKLLKFCGVEAFEGSASSPDQLEEARQVDGFFEAMKGIADRLSQNWNQTERPIFSIGGTAYLDRVLLMSRKLTDTYRVVVRSGCYVTHDHGSYDKKQKNARLRWPEMPEFKTAFELWSYVQSRPQPDLAFLTFGKRDAPYDLDLPFPLYAYANGEKQELHEAVVKKMNDQHAYLSINPAQALNIGDLVCCGISHPCTAFDKWRVLPVVDDDYNVVDLYVTFF